MRARMSPRRIMPMSPTLLALIVQVLAGASALHGRASLVQHRATTTTGTLRRSAAAPRILPLQMMAQDVQVGSQIIAGNDWNSSSPEYGIIRAQAYELQRVYYQGVVDGTVARIDVGSIEAGPPAGCAGFTKYLVLFSKRYHDKTGPVILKPTEVTIVTVKDEIADSAWLALPGLFWVWLAYSIYQYGETHGFVNQRF